MGLGGRLEVLWCGSGFMFLLVCLVKVVCFLVEGDVKLWCWCW